MNSHFLQVRVVLLELQTLRGVLFVLSGDVTAHAGNSTILLLGALEDNLHSSVFILLCHVSLILSVFGSLFPLSYRHGKEHQQSTLRPSKAVAKVLLFFESTIFFLKKNTQTYLLHCFTNHYKNIFPLFFHSFPSSFLLFNDSFFTKSSLLISAKSYDIFVEDGYFLQQERYTIPQKKCNQYSKNHVRHHLWHETSQSIVHLYQY